MGWLRTSGWHYAIRIPCDVLLHGARRYPTAEVSLYPPLGEACLYRRVGLWTDGTHRCNLVLATVKGAKESWAVITDEAPRSADLMAICVEISSPWSCFWKRKSGAFELEDSRLRSSDALERLYLVAAVALLYATTQGMAVQLAFFAATG